MREIWFEWHLSNGSYLTNIISPFGSLPEENFFLTDQNGSLVLCFQKGEVLCACAVLTSVKNLRQTRLVYNEAYRLFDVHLKVASSFLLLRRLHTQVCLSFLQHEQKCGEK